MWTLTELEKQLEENRFQIYFYPYYNLKNMSISAVETAVFHVSDENELEPYTKFLPDLDEANLVSVLDMWVLNKASTIQQNLFKQGIRSCPIYIKVSVWTLSNPYNVYDIALALKTYKLPERAICLALTSTRPYFSALGLNKGISFLRESGMEVMLSNFGKECNTLALFSDVCVDMLQIDGTFVKKSMESEQIETVLRHVILLANQLNLVVIFNGIDELKKFQYIKSLGAKYAGGEVLGKRISEQEFLEKVY